MRSPVRARLAPLSKHDAATGPRVIYQHPLAYLLGLEGVTVLWAFSGAYGLPLVKVGPEAELGYMRTYARLASDYLAAALPLGLEARRCEEPRRLSPLVGDDGTDLYDGIRPPDHVPGNPPDIGALHRFYPAATNAAWRGQPAAIIWHFQLSAD